MLFAMHYLLCTVVFDILTCALRSLMLSDKLRVPLQPGSCSDSWPGAINSSVMPSSCNSIMRMAHLRSPLGPGPPGEAGLCTIHEGRAQLSDRSCVTCLEIMVFNQLEGHHCRSFFNQQLAVGGHAARADAAYVGVVASTGHKEHDPAAAEHWRDDGDVWQMTPSSQLRVVGQEHVTLLRNKGAAELIRQVVCCQGHCLVRDKPLDHIAVPGWSRGA